MELSNLIENLNMSKFGLLWATLTGGWKGLSVYVCKAFTSLLKRLDADGLAKYAELVRSVLCLVKTIVNGFVPDAYKQAGIKTVEAIETLSAHIEDGEYTEDELKVEIANIEACVDEWRNVSK